MPCVPQSQAQLRKEKRQDLGWICAIILIVGIAAWLFVVMHNDQVACTNQAKAAAIQLQQLDRDEWPRILEQLEWPFKAVSLAGDGYVYPDSASYKFKTMNGDQQLRVIWVFQYEASRKKWKIGRYNLAPEPKG